MIRAQHVWALHVTRRSLTDPRGFSPGWTFASRELGTTDCTRPRDPCRHRERGTSLSPVPHVGADPRVDEGAPENWGVHQCPGGDGGDESKLPTGIPVPPLPHCGRWILRMGEEGRKTQTSLALHPPLRGTLCFAGVYEEEPRATGAIITTPSNELIAPIHDRMPAILPPNRYDFWLDPTNRQYERLQQLLVPYPAEEMVVQPAPPPGGANHPLSSVTSSRGGGVAPGACACFPREGGWPHERWVPLVSLSPALQGGGRPPDVLYVSHIFR